MSFSILRTSIPFHSAVHSTVRDAALADARAASGGTAGATTGQGAGASASASASASATTGARAGRGTNVDKGAADVGNGTADTTQAAPKVPRFPWLSRLSQQLESAARSKPAFASAPVIGDNVDRKV